MMTTQPQHTPEPWMFDGEDKCLIVDQSQEPDAICDCNPSFSPANNKRQLAVCQANARLIATAPDLLAACKAHDEWFDLVKQNYPEMVRPYEQGRAAIAKATKQEPETDVQT